jgi:hypothetical protein
VGRWRRRHPKFDLARSERSVLCFASLRGFLDSLPFKIDGFIHTSTHR